MGPRNAGNVMKKPTNSKKTILRMIKDFKKEMGLIIFVVILSILSAVLNVYSPILLQDIFNSVSEIFKMEGNVITISWNIFYQKFGIIIGVYIVSAILQWLSQYIAASIGARYAYEMRDRVQKKLDKLPLSYFDKTSYGDTLSIGTNDVDNISRNLQTIITQLFAGIALFLGSLIAMLVTDWRLALVALVSLPLTLIIVVLISKFSGKQFTTYRNELGVLNGKIEEDYAGYMIIKLFNKEKDIEQDFDESNEKMAKADGNSQFLS
ncbi:MAG: ABC transporter ATP-binding protein, partial [Bacilli bacterium]